MAPKVRCQVADLFIRGVRRRARMARMRAWEVNDGTLDWSQVADPQPGTDEAAVRVLSAGVCASDVARLTKPVIPSPPGRAWRPGHEIVGQVDGHAVAVNPLVA